MSKSVLEIAREALDLMLQQFTRTPSTYADSDARCKAHAAIAAIDVALSPAADPDPALWTIYHNGKSVTGKTIMRAARAAQSLRTEEEQRIAAENLLRAVDEELAAAASESVLDECLANGNHQACYRVRCNLGKECVASQPKDMSTASTHAPDVSTEAGNVSMSDARALSDDEIIKACRGIYLSDHPLGSQSYDIAIARAVLTAQGEKK